MQNPRTGMRWIAAAIASISITTVTHAASVAPVAAENGMVVAAQHLASKVAMDPAGERIARVVVPVGAGARQPLTKRGDPARSDLIDRALEGRADVTDARGMLVSEKRADCVDQRSACAQLLSQNLKSNLKSI